MEIRFKNVSVSFGNIGAISDLSFTAPAGKLLAVLGPSGSGKSTLLMLLTGLLAPDNGEISIGEQIVSSGNKILVAPRQRQVGMVFQTLALWPHMTVRQNIEFALKGKHPKDEITARVSEILSLTGLSDYAKTYPSNLSGGERQRVALARALVAKPEIFLLDEPLSSLDRHLSKKLLPLIREYHEKFHTTTIYVTHDQSEALNIADFVMVIKNGRMMQFDTPENIYHKPVNRFVASFMGDVNLLESKFASPDSVKTNIGEISCAPNDKLSGRNTIAVIRPENLTINNNGNIKGRVIACEFKGDNWLAEIDAGGNAPLLARFPDKPQAGAAVSLSINKPVWIIENN
ncbi:MAG: ABC transporter ATP-binding protein [Candidatus Brocadiia bacterium]